MSRPGEAGPRSPTEPSSIRPATSDDLGRIVEIEKRVQRAPWTREHFEKELEKPYSRALVMTDDETDEKILGYIVYWLLLEDCQILTLAVDLPYRGLGLARQMVRFAAGEAMKAKFPKMQLEVRKSNLPAIQLYQSAGFSITQIRKSFYSDGEDAYQMSLPLEDDGIGFI